MFGVVAFVFCHCYKSLLHTMGTPGGGWTPVCGKQWINSLFFFACVHNFCFSYLNVFILMYKFSFIFPVVSMILLVRKWASGCVVLGCQLGWNHDISLFIASKIAKLSTSGTFCPQTGPWGLIAHNLQIILLHWYLYSLGIMLSKAFWSAHERCNVHPNTYVSTVFSEK